MVGKREFGHCGGIQQTLALILSAALLLGGAILPGPACAQGLADLAPTAGRVDLGERVPASLAELTAYLDANPGLTQVDMYAAKLTAAQMDELAARYPGIRFGFTIRIAEHTVRTDATAFSTLHNNKSKTHTTEDFSVLRHCRDLQALDLGHNHITDISFIAQLPKLKVLILACNEITDISPLAQLQHLEYLELFKNHIADASPLAGLPGLVDLNLCFNNIADYRALYGLASLERLWIYSSNSYNYKTPLPEGLATSLREALPSCYVDDVSYSTLGGWRKHPRYDIIFDIFKTGVYKPWDKKAS
jgi:hypothetical protein